MGKVTAFEHQPDGVMQAPGRPDEDTRGGSTAGGRRRTRPVDVEGRG